MAGFPPPRHPRDPFRKIGAEWSNPEAIPAVLERLGMPVPRRLHTGRFHEMIAALERLGIEAQGAGGERLTQQHGSPGIHAAVRLRRSPRAAVADAPAPRPEEPPGSSISKLRISNFKSFETAELPLSALTLLIGANASGKSNALEALQLLSWMAGGRRLSNIGFAMKGADLAIRGTANTLTWTGDGGSPIELGCSLEQDAEGHSLDLTIQIGVESEGLRIVGEELYCPEESPSLPLYRVTEPASQHGREMQVEYNNFARGGHKPRITCVDEQPVFAQLMTPARFGANHEKSQEVIPNAARRLQVALEGVLFLDPSPRAMRGYSFLSEQRLLGDGSNLSGVLHGLTETTDQKDEVLEFIRALPEQDILDISYLEGPRGEVMVQLAESFGGRHMPREAALLSDGTLRVLATAAALLSVPHGSMVVIEEIDNGVHPSRAAHLLQRIQDIAARRGLRILLTTHNPALLDALPSAALPHVVACFRDTGSGSSRLVRLEDLVSYPELIARGPLGQLVTRGVLDRYLKSPQSPEERRARNLDWLENALGGGKS
jgi:predicted ATPase